MTMTLTTTTAPPRARRPDERGPAPARPRRGARSPAGSGRSARRSTAPRRSRTSSDWLEREGWLAQLRPRGSRRAARRAARTRVLGLRGLQVPRGDRLGDRPHATTCRRTTRGAVPRGRRARRAPRRSPTATSTRSSAGPARSRGGPTSSGGTSCTASGTCSRRPSPARARVPTPTTASSTIARRAADLVCDVFGAGGIESHLRPRRDRGRPGGARPRHRGAALPRAGRACSSSGAATGTLARHRVGPVVLPGRRAGARRRRAARARGAGQLPRRRRRRTSRSRPATTSCCDALDRQWERTVARRTYVTGGQGSHHQDEAFGDDWVLPPDRAYSETCAGVGSVMFSWRLLLAQGDPRYADLIERTLFNVVATSPCARGHRVLLREHAAPAACPGAEPTPTTVSPRAAVVAARALVRRVVLPAERRPHLRQPRGVRRDRGRRRASSCTSTRPRRSARRSTAGSRSRSRWRPSTRGRGRCGFAC